MDCFTIDAQLPGLNEYTRACRSHWSKGAALKENIENLICWSIRAAQTKQELSEIKQYPAVVTLEWHEATRRRDVDNIQSAQKFILDAMQKCGVIPSDGRKHISQIHHKVIDDDRDFVIVCIN